MTKVVPLMLFAVVIGVRAGAQNRSLYDDLESLGLDPVLLHESGYYTNTRDGHTVVQGRDQRWYYARLNEFGNVVPTDVLVGPLGKRSSAERAFLQEAATHLETEPAIRNQLLHRAKERKFAIEQAANLRAAKGLTSESSTILVLAIEFRDLKASTDIRYLDSLMNVNTWDPASGQGGFRDYFVENSYGKFIPQSRVYGWFEAEHPFSYYADTLDRLSASARLVEEALRQADTAGVDFSTFDKDNDMHVETVMLVTPVRISAHYAHLGPQTELQDIIFNSYSIQEADLGVLVHEYGHALGLRDLYKPPHPFGYNDVMASASMGGSPGHFSAYSKMLLGWLDPKIIDASVTDLRVPNSHDSPFALLIRGRDDTDWSYFIVENRVKKGYDSGKRAVIPSSGLVIYHIHEHSIDWSHVEQADGGKDLEMYSSTGGLEGNRGDAGDLFPGTTGNTQFGDETSPSSRTKGGQDTGISITNISLPAGTMTIDVHVEGTSSAVATSSEVVPTRSRGAVVHPNYPNPFSTTTTIQYELPERADVTLEIFDPAGRKVATLESGLKPAGLHSVPFSARSLPAGRYFCRLLVGGVELVRPLIMIK